MNTLPEEQDAWIQDLKENWPDPGHAPEVRIPTGASTSPNTFRLGWGLAAAAVVLVAVGLGTWSPSPSTPPSDWPEFSSQRVKHLQALTHRISTATRFAKEEETSHSPLSIRTRLRALHTQDTWRN